MLIAIPITKPTTNAPTIMSLSFRQPIFGRAKAEATSAARIQGVTAVDERDTLIVKNELGDVTAV